MEVASLLVAHIRGQLTYWTHRSQIWKVMRLHYKLLERVFDRVNRDGGVCGQVPHSRYKIQHTQGGKYEAPCTWKLYHMPPAQYPAAVFLLSARLLRSYKRPRSRI